MTTYTALGDSITLGIGDPVRPVRPGGPRWRGWAVLLADSLDQPSLHILAASGGRAADVESTQLPRALQLRPDLASVVFGINDTLRPGFDPDGFAATAAHVVGALRAAGADVLTTWAAVAAKPSGSKPGRSVSLMPNTTLARSGRS